jgi:hypothetical protein
LRVNFSISKIWFGRSGDFWWEQTYKKGATAQYDAVKNLFT